MYEGDGNVVTVHTAPSIPTIHPRTRRGRSDVKKDDKSAWRRSKQEDDRQGVIVNTVIGE